MIRKKEGADAQLKEVKTAGYKYSKREKNVNKKAGLHDKKKNIAEGESRVNRRKPLALKHVRRMRKAAVALSCVFVVAVGAVGAGAFLGDEGTTYTGYKTVCYEVPQNAGSPTEYTLVENVGFMNYVLQNQPFWSSEMSSDVNAMGFDQHVETYKQFYNGILISCDIALGFSNKGTQYCVNPAKEVILWRQATGALNGMDSEWSQDKISKMDFEKFIEWRGFPPSEFSVYVLNEKTIQNAEDYSVIQNADGNFEMTLKLNVGLSTEEAEFAADCYYVKQMKATGDLPSLPSIKKTNVTYVFDANWRVLSFEINDEYTAMGAIPCTSKTVVTFDYAEENAKNDFYGVFKQYEDSDSSDIIDEAPSASTYLGAAFGSVLIEGGIFKIDLNVDNLALNGVAYVGMENKSLTDLRIKIGDIFAFTGADGALYITDGTAEYKMDISGLFASEEQPAERSVSAGLDTEALMQQIMNGKFTVGENSTLLETVLELFGLNVNLTFEFIPGNGTIDLGYCAAEIPLGDKLIKAKLTFGNESDIPAKPADISGYTDILNEGVTVGLTAKFDGLTLDGFAHIAMNAGEFNGVYAELGDFSVYYNSAADMLGLSDGNVKYKLNVSKLSSGASFDLGALAGGLDTSSLLSQIIANFSADGGKISTGAALDILGQTVTAAIGVQLTGGIKIDASASIFDKDIAIGVGLINKSVELPDLSEYTDILNEGITLEVSVTLDELTLDGAVYIGLNDGKFTELRAELGEFAIYYKDKNVYITDGNVKYMLPASMLGGASSAGFINIDVEKLIKDIILNLEASEGSVSAGATLSLFGKVISAGLNINLNGGLSVDASVNIKDLLTEEGAESALDLNVKIHAGFTNRAVTLPDLSGFVDISNGEITLNAELMLDGVSLNGTVTVGIVNGKFVSLTAVFGELRVDYEGASKTLYIAAGETKAFIDMNQIPYGTADMAGLFGSDYSKLICDVLANLSAGLREISTNADINILDCVIPANVSIVLPADGEGLKVKADVMLFGISAKVTAGLKAEGVPPLSSEEKEVYIDALKKPFEIADKAVGGLITAEVSGTLYDYGSEYLSSSRVKYTFEAALEYDSGKDYVAGEEQTVNPLYLHVYIGLTAYNPKDGSLYLDLLITDANPASTDGNGKTVGGYYTDGVMDVYLSVSNKKNGTPLKIYADIDEILTLVSMAGAAANLDDITFEDNATLSQAVAQLGELLDSNLIDKYLPYTKDQFASLGASLIPQILNKSLGEFLGEIIAQLGKSTASESAGGLKINLNAPYIDSITYGDNDLQLVLNSSAVYGAEIDKENNLTVIISKDTLENGASRLGGVDIKNIYFGENNVNKLDINLALSYGAIARPDGASGLGGYLNAEGIDTLLKALVNSATHETGEKEDGSGIYELNSTYLLSGKITADMLSVVKVDLDVKTLKVVIKEDNTVYADAHFGFYYELTKLSKTSGEIYMSIMNDMVFVKRVIDGTEETRIMSADAFADDIITQIGWMFNFPNWIMNIIKNQVDKGSGGDGVQFEGKDYGEILEYVLPQYKFNDADNSWAVTIGGGMLKDFTGMDFGNGVSVTFNAVKNGDGTYTVTGLTIPEFTINVGVKINLSGSFLYDNPHEVLAEGKEDTSKDLINGPLTELNGNSWHEVLGGESFEEICNATDWGLLESETGLSYISFYNGSPLAIATLKFEYATDTQNSNFAEFGERQLILYNTGTNTVYTKVTAPELPEDKNTDTMRLDWIYGLVKNSDGTVTCRAEYMRTYKVTVESEVDLGEAYVYDETENVYRRTEEQAYKVIYLKKDTLLEVDGATYGLKGYKLKGTDTLVTFDSFGYDEDGGLCFAAPVTGEACYVAVWDSFYAVNFIAKDENGETVGEITVHYFEGETLSSRLPEVPELKGHKGEWVYSDMTVAPGMTAEQRTVYANYTKEIYTVTIQSDVEVSGFELKDGKYVKEISAEYGTEITLPALNPVSNGFIFTGYGNVETTFTLEENVSYTAEWQAKTVNVTFKSDLQFTGAKQDGGYYVESATFRYGAANETLMGVGEAENLFLGWFMETAAEDGSKSYVYISDAEALKNTVLPMLADKESISVTLGAVWINATIDVVIESATRTGTWLIYNWTISGSYSGGDYASDYSREIADNSNLVRYAEVRYEQSKQEGHLAEKDDTLGGGTWYELTENSFSASKLQCANSRDYGGARVRVTFSVDGSQLYQTEYSNFKKR